MITLIKQWFFPIPTFVPDVPMMVDCHQCKRLITYRAANRLTVHLVDDHKLEHNEVYKTVDWVFARMQEHLRRTK